MTFNMYRVSVKNLHILTYITLRNDIIHKDHVDFINSFNVSEQKNGGFSSFLIRKHWAHVTLLKYHFILVCLCIIKNRCQNGTWADLHSILSMAKYEDIKITILSFAKLKECAWFGDWRYRMNSYNGQWRQISRLLW